MEIDDGFPKILAVYLVVGHGAHVDGSVDAYLTVFDEQVDDCRHIPEPAAPRVAEHDFGRLGRGSD